MSIPELEVSMSSTLLLVMCEGSSPPFTGKIPSIVSLDEATYFIPSEQSEVGGMCEHRKAVRPGLHGTLTNEACHDHSAPAPRINLMTPKVLRRMHSCNEA